MVSILVKKFRPILYLAVVILAVGATWFQLAYQRTPPLPVFKHVPDFQLTERNGKTVALADLKGKVWIADFFYASCPGPCPVIAGRLGRLQDELLKINDVRLVSITTDPEMDTPEVLRKYADRFHASPDKWLFLTGDKARIYNLANSGFLLSAVEQKGAPENPVIHSTKLALVDRAGNIRAYYDGADDTNTKQILYDVRRLLRE